MRWIKSFVEDIRQMNDTPIIFSVFIIFFFGIIMYLSIYIFLFIWPLEKVNMYAEVFNKSAIGLGALLAGIGALRFLSGPIKGELEIIRKKDYLRLYPISNFPKRFDIVNRKSKQRSLYLRDKKEKIVRHIGNGYTYNELGWTKFNTKTLEDNTFNKYKKGEVILIAGKVGG